MSQATFLPVDLESIELLRAQRLIQDKHRTIWHRDRIKRFYSILIRNQRVQLWKSDLLRKRLLNVGCAANIFDDFVNVDYIWRPHLDLCWDIMLGIPLPDNSMEGIFTEHCLEHITFRDVTAKVLPEFMRMLRPGGTLRISVPDAECLLDMYHQVKHGGAFYLPPSADDLENGDEIPADSTPMMRVNRTFRNYGHQYAWDFQTLEFVLHRAGFVDVRKEAYMCGRERALLVDSKRRADESLYVEASAPR